MIKSKNRNRIVLGLILILILVLTIYSTRHSLVTFYKIVIDGEKLKNYLEGFGVLSWLIFFILQILQVVVFFIPGEVIQAAGGYVFGTFFGTVISFFGIGVGSYILFLITHMYGRNLVEKLVSKDLHNRLEKILDNKKNKLIVLLLYLIPGVPKDSLVMICGLSNLTAREFIFYSMIGRIPALTISSYFGANIASGEHGKAIIISIIALIIILIGVIFKEKIFKTLSKI
ncbi:TVP38/TMEM64 family protein [Clostridium paraputrificum]|uniref:TVP38/TMEM64 family protein n=1 Tax=Clostridium TaxID=1485 RepID=UPI003D353BC7